jgi:hypothetical protein
VDVEHGRNSSESDRLSGFGGRNCIGFGIRSKWIRRVLDGFAFAGRLVDDGSQFFNRWGGSELRMKDVEVAEIGAESIQAIEYVAGETNLLLDLSGREIRNRRCIDRVGASFRYSLASSRTSPAGMRSRTLPCCAVCQTERMNGIPPLCQVTCAGSCDAGAPGWV